MKTLKRIFISPTKTTAYYRHVGVTLQTTEEGDSRLTLDLFPDKGTITGAPECSLVFTKEELKEFYKAIGSILRHAEDKKTTEETEDDLLI